MDSDSLRPRPLFGGLQLTLVAVFLSNLPGDLTLGLAVLLLLVGSFLVFNGLLGDGVDPAT
ncbi:hypothetical protein [Haloglomus litoreum]|uniref:hypothetical protein n=1 Tax=Haloglomus litoreum TaxID=3034026 RepID=UPI0023E79B63|nr:hypothetical protein [Haloglomus sp. DT116]